MWIDPRDTETPFGEFAEEWYEAVVPRLEPNTRVKYRSYLDNHLLPQWRRLWPMIGIFNGYVEIERWLTGLHDEEYAESSIASIFATFSTILNAGVRAKIIPANPCYGIRVTGGEFENERLLATPVQVLRAAMRLYESEMGLSGFTLCLLDFYTGGRWSELVGQERHEYDESERAITIRYPLKEVNGKLLKAGVEVSHDRPTARPDVGHITPRRTKGKRGRTKTPAGTRPIALPPSIAVFYETLLDSHRGSFAFTSPDGALLRRANFRQRFWRPAWDGRKPEQPNARDHTPAILPWITFQEGRHTHATWMVEDGVPQVARRARLGQKMKGIARVYDRDERHEGSADQRPGSAMARIAAGAPGGRVGHNHRMVPVPADHRRRPTSTTLREDRLRFVSFDLAQHARSPASRSRAGLLTCVYRWWTILGLNQ
ncbi:integrase [Saccharothrix sp. NRRL B-16314]|uniref:integrase n=1 Tax=Saccharothrix sp. NRRL B-16314 TaxID=1463825 RepID=UPI002F35F85B